MFIRKNKNRKGTVSVQLISKSSGKYQVVKTIGTGDSEPSIELLYQKAKQELAALQKQQSLFVSKDDALIESYLSSLENAQVSTVGPELIFGKIYDSIGFNAIKESLFRHLVISRLAFPLSKLKTVDYLYRYQGVLIGIDTVYRFLDKLNATLKDQVEQITYKHTLKVLKNNISIVFYDMTTIYLEASVMSIHNCRI